MYSFKIPVGIFDTHVKFHVDLDIDKIEGIITEDELGVTLKHPDGHCDVYIWKSDDLRALVHEVYHCVSHILASRGVEDEEAGAYLMDYLVVKYKLGIDRKMGKNLTKKLKRI